MLKIRQTYNSCTDLPLNVFIQILINDKKELLYREPKTAWNKKADLDLIWEGIFIEYTELSNDTRSVTILHLMKDITVLSHKIDIIQNSILLLATVDDLTEYKPTIELLKRLGFRRKYEKETINEDLKWCVSSAKRLVSERDELQKQLDNLNNSEQEKATEKDFYVNLANLSENVGFAIDPNNTTVMQYISYLETQRAKIKSDE